MNTKAFLLAALTVLFACTIASAQVEEITLSTYYPAPYGEYEEMAAEKLFVDKQIIGNMDVDGDGDFSDSDDMAAMGVGSLLVENNLGIGTASPDRILTVKSGAGTDTFLKVLSNGIAYNAATEYSDGLTSVHSGMLGGWSAAAQGKWSVLINGNWMLMDTNGNVGIGTMTPAYPLDVYTTETTVMRFGQKSYLTARGDTEFGIMNGATQDASNIFTATSTEASGIFVDNGNIKFFSNWGGLTPGQTFTPNERMRIANDGNVGIGTTSPGVELDITTSDTEAAIDLETTAAGGNNWRLSSDNSGNFGIGEVATGRKVTVQQNGNVGVNTTSPGARLHVNANGNSEYYFAMTDTQTGGNTWRFYGGAGCGAGADNLGLYNVDGARYTVIWRSNGNVWIAGKLTQAGCPDYSDITPLEFIQESINKTEHTTQEEVDALMRVVIEQAEQIKKLTVQIENLQAKFIAGHKK